MTNFDALFDGSEAHLLAAPDAPSAGLNPVAWLLVNGVARCSVHSDQQDAERKREVMQRAADLSGSLMAYRVVHLVCQSDAAKIIASKDGVISAMHTELMVGQAFENNLLDKVDSKDAEIERLRALIDEQKGTIRALNMALGGDESTSTENLIEAQRVDHGCAGLIPLADALRAGGMKLQAEVERLTKSWQSDVWQLTTERDATIAQQAERIAAIESRMQSLAQSVMTDQVSDDSHALFIAAIRDLAAISDALGCDPDDGGAVPIIDAIDELKDRIAAQSAALAKAREALNGVCDGEECEDADGYLASIISLEALHDAQEALAAIDALGQPEGEKGGAK